jgi:LuxR family maltose regulon positive regulatory protein
MKNLLLTTKLQRPNLPSDFIFRKKLLDYVNENIKRPLTLVAAGAGFGKSTFVSSWIKDIPYKNAWVSLDNSDNDLRNFLQYFVAAIRNEYPEFGGEILNLLHATQLPPLKVLANSLINELTGLTQFFIMVLDDFHVINNQDVIDLLSSLLKFPPDLFHLVLITRSDPSLPLASLRAKNKLKDVRAIHLRLSPYEIKSFLLKYIQSDNVDKIIPILEDKLEGWIAGLRLAILHLSLHSVKNEKIETILSEMDFSEEYFLEEILEHIDENTKEFLLKTSILEKFSPSLADYLLHDIKKGFNSEQLIHHFVKNNLFIINLDNKKIWYRYHHLFQSLLRKELSKKYSRASILNLHERAVEWYESHALIDEAFLHASQMDSMDKMVVLIEKHMVNLINREKWHVLEKWLEYIPMSSIRKSPALLIAKMWNLQNNMVLWEVADLLPVFDELTHKMEIDENLKTLYQFLKALLLYWSSDIEDIKASFHLLTYVKDHLSEEIIGVKGVNANYYACAAHVSGKGAEVKQELDRIIFNEQLNPTYRILTIGANIFRELLSGNLDSVVNYCKILKKLAEQYDDTFATTWYHYFSAYVYFQQNRVEKAIIFFKKALENVYMLNVLASVDSFAGLLLCQQQLNEKNEFEETCQNMFEFVNTSNNQAYISYAHSAKARLHLIEKKMSPAEKHMNMVNTDLEKGNTVAWIETPRITHCRFLLAYNDLDKTNEAIKKLSTHITFAEKTRNIPLLINSLILQAVAHKKMENNKEASDLLLKALLAAKTGTWIRPFIESASDIYHLILHLETDKSIEEYRMLIVNALSEYLGLENRKVPALRAVKSFNVSSTAFDELSNRELDVISLLSQRLSNNEIADKLFISLATVKRHAVTIYQKLGVNNRRHAVKRAMEVGILPPDNNSY